MSDPDPMTPATFAALAAELQTQGDTGPTADTIVKLPVGTRAVTTARP